MNQLTIRGFDDQLERRLRELALAEELSLNRAALLLLRRGAGLSALPKRPNVVDRALDDFFGVWSEEEEREFLESMRALEQIDAGLWS
ncbi:MAG: hypothetical protein GY856_52755 [bacterium]|nr:hypothetical protein [bacterium]